VFAVTSYENGLQRVLANQTKRAWVKSANQVQTYIWYCIDWLGRISLHFTWVA